MAKILNDTEIKRLIGTVIKDGDSSSIRPNSYVLRVGSDGEFLNTQKPFNIGGDKKDKKGIRIGPGHSVALTALETIDFSSETVHSIFPGCALHGLISPTTDLSREGLVAPATQVDAGYEGTLNWTITNTSNEERRFLYGERIFRLTILKLEEGEIPENVYGGDYHGRRGYVRSQRKGAPVGMRESDWEDAITEDGPEVLLDNLLKSGYPWHALGQRLKSIGNEIKVVTDEYGEIHDSLLNLQDQVATLSEQYREIRNTVKDVVKDYALSLQNRWLIMSGVMILGLIGLVLTVLGTEPAMTFIEAYAPWIGLTMIFIAVSIVAWLTSNKG